MNITCTRCGIVPNLSKSGAVSTLIFDTSHNLWTDTLRRTEVVISDHARGLAQEEAITVNSRLSTCMVPVTRGTVKA